MPYFGTIIDEGEIKDVDRTIENGDGKELDLKASLKVVNHSPTGFSWGYQGSGPAQAALAILLDHFRGDKGRALGLYQQFKSNVIAKLPIDEDFVITEAQMEAAIVAIDVERMKKA